VTTPHLNLPTLNVLSTYQIAKPTPVPPDIRSYSLIWIQGNKSLHASPSQPEFYPLSQTFRLSTPLPFSSVLTVAATSALDQIFLQIDELLQSQTCPDDTPTSFALSTARDTLTDANRLVRIPDASVVEASEGDILIHWNTKTRSVVLISPRSGVYPSIYKETLQGLIPTSSQLITEASPELLSEALAWAYRQNP